MTGIIETLFIAVSLCADCFAVSLCSGVTLKRVKTGNVLAVAFSFAVIQSLLLLIGWLFGNVFVGLVSGISHVIGFLLLLYVGGSMLVEALKGKGQARNLSGLKNILLGGLATSLDALAVGVSQSMAGLDTQNFTPLFLSVFAVTFISVVCGILGGRVLGTHFGRIAEIGGGIVLIFIGVTILL